MKKLMMTLAAALSATALMAEVTSQNVVGYQTFSLPAGAFKMLGVQFDTVDGEVDSGIPLNDLVKGDMPYGTQIQVLKASGSGYDYYTYIAEAYDAELDDFVPGWGDGQEDLALVPIKAGQAFWIKSLSACTVLIAGEVLEMSDKTLSATGGQFSMISKPYPVPVNLNDLTWTGLTYGDQVQVLKAGGAGYDYFNYLEEAYDAELDDFVPGWADGQEDLMSTPIPAGQGFWIKPAAAVTAKFETPL